MISETIASPIGPLVLVEAQGVLVTLAFAHRWSVALKHLKRHWGLVELQPGSCLAKTPVQAFFQGDKSAFGGVDWRGPGTVFQREVWRKVAAIPWGQTRSYLEVAHSLGRPNSVRAVANAVGSNPVALVVPCHRVIGSDGSLTGFGGGLAKKCHLLRHEGVDA